MKTFKNLFILITLLATGITSCTKNSVINPPGLSTANIIQQGTWVVTYYNDSGTDESNHFAGYDFTFNSNGTVTAVNNSGTINGTWDTGTDDSQKKLNLYFGTTALFDDMNDDWHVLDQTSAKIRLEDISGGGSGTDQLTFEKK